MYAFYGKQLIYRKLQTQEIVCFDVLRKNNGLLKKSLENKMVWNM